MPLDSPDDLYGLPLDRFTDERNALAKRLRADKQREEAARVAKLKKPTVAAWAVNQLVRTQPNAINALFTAGDALSRAQAKGQADRLRAAMEEQRAAQQELVERAQGLLDSDGHALGAAVLEKVSETLRAAAIDPESREQVEAGCLIRELQFSGFLGAGSPTPAKRPEAKLEQARERQRVAEDAAKAAREALQHADRELRAAEKDVRAAERGRKGAEDRRDEAAKALERAKADQAKARDVVKRLER